MSRDDKVKLAFLIFEIAFLGTLVIITALNLLAIKGGTP